MCCNAVLCLLALMCCAILHNKKTCTAVKSIVLFNKNQIAHYCVRTVKSLKDQKHDAVGCLERDTSFNRFY